MNFRSTTVKRMLLGSAALFATGAWALPPSASDTLTRTETVAYSPSEVTTDEGAEQLYRRLQAAAARVCSDPVPQLTHGHGQVQSYASCVKEALDGAVKQVGLPVVSVLHTHGTAAAGSRTVASR